MISKFIRQCGYYTWISFTTTWGPIQWRPWYLLHTSTTYGDSLSRWRWVFFLMVFSGWNPTYLRTDSYVHNILHITHITYTMHIYLVETGGPASERRGYCDSVVRTGTSCTGSVRTEYVFVLSVLLVPSVLLVVYLSLILQCCTSTRHPTSHIHHIFV